MDVSEHLRAVTLGVSPGYEVSQLAIVQEARQAALARSHAASLSSSAASSAEATPTISDAEFSSGTTVAEQDGESDEPDSEELSLDRIARLTAEAGSLEVSSTTSGSADDGWMPSLHGRFGEAQVLHRAVGDESIASLSWHDEDGSFSVEQTPQAKADLTRHFTPISHFGPEFSSRTSFFSAASLAEDGSPIKLRPRFAARSPGTHV